MRILVISDIHANLSALHAVLQAAGSFDVTWNLGDTVGYGPRPRQCLQAMRDLNPAINLSGNHDLASIGAISIEAFNPIAKAAALWTAQQLDATDREYLEGLPAITRQESVLFAHGSPRDPVWEYVDSSAVATPLFLAFDFRQCYVGHTHQAVVATPDQASGHTNFFNIRDGDEFDLTTLRLLINPGSTGQPRDGDPRAAYGIVDTSRNVFIAHRVAYDVEFVQREMLAAGLPAPLADRLAIGH